MEKITNAKALTFVLTNYKETLPTEVADKLNAMLIQVQKKSSGEKKPTKTQTENVGIKETILAFLVENSDKAFTVTEMLKSIDGLSELSNQKISALVRQLKDDGKVTRTEEKGKAYFKAC